MIKFLLILSLSKVLILSLSKDSNRIIPPPCLTQVIRVQNFSPPPTKRDSIYKVMGEIMKTRFFVLCLYLLGGSAALADPLLVSSALPTARTATVGETVTFFATVINAGDMEAQNCFIEKFSQNLAQANFFPGGFAYQTVDASNIASGTPNTPINIPVGGTQSFVFALTPDAPFSGVVQLRFRCDGGFEVNSQPGINDVFLTATAAGSPMPDPIAILATPSADGALRIAAAGGIEAAGGAVVNVRGDNAVVRARPRVAFNANGATLSICETNNLGICIVAPTPFVDITIGAVGKTFTVFANASDRTGMAFLPGLLRLFVDFSEPGGDFLSGTSVALTAPMPELAQTPQFPSGYYRTQLRYRDDTFAGRIQNGYVLIDVDGSVTGVTEWTISNFQGRHSNHVFEAMGNWSAGNAATADMRSKPQANPPEFTNFAAGPTYFPNPTSDGYNLASLIISAAIQSAPESDFSTLSGVVTGDPTFRDDPNGPKGDTANVMLEAILALGAAAGDSPIKAASRPKALADATYTLVDAARVGGIDVANAPAHKIGFTGSATIIGTALTADVTYTGQDTCNLSATIGMQINDSNIYRLPGLNLADCATDRMVNAPSEYEGFLILNEANAAAPGDNVRLILLKKDRNFSFALLGTKN